MRLKDGLLDVEGHVDNQGTIKSIPDEIKYDFSYLDKKIHVSNSTNVVLEQDIKFEDYEIDFYEGGIELDVDDLTIDGNGKTIDGAKLFRIFIITSQNVTLKNITFKNGRTYENLLNKFNECGGALKINGGVNVSIENCKFISNVSENNGGAISQKNGNLCIHDLFFTKNRALKKGGAIHNNCLELAISDSILYGNSSEMGGAIFHDGRNLTISDSTLNENSAENGGAIYQRINGLVITNSTLNENTAKTGGAIDNRNGELDIVESIINKNIATMCGGAIHSSFGILTVTDLNVNENVAKQYENLSAMATKGGEVIITRSRIGDGYVSTNKRKFF